MPSRVLPEMRLPAPPAPTSVLGAWMNRPSTFPMAVVPTVSVPMRFSPMVFPVPFPTTRTPAPLLPEITLPSSNRAPLWVPSSPITLLDESAIEMPSSLPRPTSPRGSVPIELERTTLPSPSSRRMPSPLKRFTVIALTLLFPAVMVRPMAAPASSPSISTIGMPR